MLFASLDCIHQLILSMGCFLFCPSPTRLWIQALLPPSEGQTQLHTKLEQVGSAGSQPNWECWEGHGRMVSKDFSVIALFRQYSRKQLSQMIFSETAVHIHFIQSGPGLFMNLGEWEGDFRVDAKHWLELKELGVLHLHGAAFPES